MTVQWKGRSAAKLGNDLVKMTMLTGGGHIASFSFTPASGYATENVIWEAPWSTADPLTPEHDELSEQYGGRPAGPFLASYTGHSLCLDCFGPPSELETSLGVTLHGEAGIANWVVESDGSIENLVARAELPIAGLQVQRKTRIAAGETVVRFEEQVRNLRDAPREIQWQQHATLGAPLVDAKSSSIASSVSKGRSWPLGYDGPCLLPSDVAFNWPYVNTQADGNDSRRDLRRPFTPPDGGYVVAVQQIPGREVGFVSALNWELGLAFGYCFRSADFPWLAVWHENRAREYAPWNGKTQALGLEFGTTPLPVGKEEMARLRSSFEGPVDRTVAPHGTVSASWLMFLADVPKTWREIQDVIVGEDRITLHEASGGQKSIVARGAFEFLRGDNAPGLFSAG
jgi:hypothetical protein